MPDPLPSPPPSTGAPPAGQPPKLLDRLRQAARVRHYSLRTEEAYVAWVRRFILFQYQQTHCTRCHTLSIGRRAAHNWAAGVVAAGRVVPAAPGPSPRRIPRARTDTPLPPRARERAPARRS